VLIVSRYALHVSVSSVALSFSAMLAATSAIAADLPSRKAAPEAILLAPQSAYSWTGFYAGVTAGVGGSGDKAKATAFGPCPQNFCTGTAGQPAVANDWVNVIGIGNPGLPFGTLSGQSIVGAGGFTLGFNQQVNQFVYGLEGDVTFLSNRQSHATSNSANYVDAGYYSGANSAISGRFSGNASPTAIGTARLRFGVAMDRTLLFATGGLAIGSVRSSTAYSYNGLANINFGGGNSYNIVSAANLAGSNTQTRVGWTLGAGVEHAIDDHLTIKADVLYYDLGNVKTVAAGSYSDVGYGKSTGATQAYQATHQINGVLARAGLNYKF